MAARVAESLSRPTRTSGGSTEIETRLLAVIALQIRGIFALHQMQETAHQFFRFCDGTADNQVRHHRRRGLADRATFAFEFDIRNLVVRIKNDAQKSDDGGRVLVSVQRGSSLRATVSASGHFDEALDIACLRTQNDDRKVFMKKIP